MGLRARVARMLVAVLVGTLFVPIGSVVLTATIPSAQATDYSCTGGGTFTVVSNVVTTSSFTCAGSVVIPSGVTSIGNSAFNRVGRPADEYRITSVTLSNTVTSVGTQAFDNNKGITSLTLGTGLTSIGSNGFNNLYGLTSLVIPGNVTTIGEWAFGNNQALTSLTLNEGLVSVGFAAFWANRVQTLVLPNSLTSLSNGAGFGNNPHMQNLTLGSSLATIGARSFEGNSGILSLNIPNATTSLGATAFSGYSRSSYNYCGTSLTQTVLDAAGLSGKTKTCLQTQTITRTSTSPTSPVISGTYTPTATASSSLTVAITIAAGSSSVCSISSGLVTFNTAGSCVIQYNQSGNASYSAAPQVTETLTIGKATPTFSTWSNVSKTFGDSPFTVTAPTVTGSVPGSFSYSSATTSVISVSGSTLTVAGAGSSVIEATFTPSNTTNYNIAKTTMTVTVSKGTPTFSAWSNVSKTFGDSPFTVTAPTVTGSVPGSFSYSSATTSVISVSGSTLTVAGAGSSVIEATFTPSNTTNYNIAKTTMTVTVGKTTPTFSAWSNVSKTFGDSPFTVTAPTVTGSVPGSFSYSSATTSVISVSGSTLTVAGAGSSVIEATFTPSNTTNYNIAKTTMTVTVSKGTPTFSAWSNVSKTFGDSPFTVTAPTVTGSVPGSFSYSSATTSVISVSGSTLTVAGAGSSVIEATFTPTDSTNYNVAKTTMTVTVGASSQSITRTSTSPTSPVTSGTYTPTATASSSLTVAISIATGSSSVCSISSGVVTFNAAGSCVIEYNQSGNANYSAATLVTETLTILSNDATLSNTSTIKGLVPTLGAANSSLGSETAGTLTLTTAQATGSAATTFVLSNSSATITKIVKFAAGSQASDFETETAFSNGSTAQITTGDFFVIQVTAGDGSVKYTRINVTVNSNIATLSNTSVIKGQAPTFGTPNATLGNETPGTLTLTTTQATGAAATTFVLSNSSATISKIVKFASGTSVSTFDTATAFSNGSTAQITTGDFFIIKVTAADGTINFSRVNVTVNSNVATISTFSFNSLTPNVTGIVDNSLRTVQLSVPSGTNVTALVATFTLSSGTTAAVASIPQISGQTTNNFTTAVTYVLTSQDSSTVQNYSVTVTVAGNPSVPRSLTAVGGQGSVSLSWSAPLSDGGRPVTGYVIESSLDSTNWTNTGTTSETTTSLNISSLSNGTTYYFRVRATNVSGSTNYNYSNIANTNTFYYVTCSVSGNFYVATSTIPSYAGRNCKGTATIPQGITGVLVAAFAPGTGSTAGDLNRDLTAIVFPATGFAQIDQGGFRNLGLTSLTIPASVTMVGLSAFENNPLTSVTVVGGSGGASTVLSQGAFSNQGFGMLPAPAIALTLGSGKIEISYNFGVKTTFSTVDFGTGLTSIDQTAFKSNGIAKGWIPFFPSTITSIGSEAFRYSPNVTTIRFGSETTTSITSIHEWAFDKNALTSVQYCGPQGNANALSRYLSAYQTSAKIWCDLIAPIAPTISTSSKTNQQVTIGWAKGVDRNEPPTDTFTVQYKSGGGSWITFPAETITALSATIGNLTNGTTYTFRVAANNIAGISSYSNEVQVTPLGLALVPTFDTSTATADGFTFNVTNYNSNYGWSGQITAGSGTVTIGTPNGLILPITVSGMGSGATSSIRISTTRITYDTGTATTAGTALNAALTPTFGTASVTTNGYTVSITNYDSNYTWFVQTSSGSAQIISGAVKVTGAAFATSVTATVTATRTSYVMGSANFVGTTLAALTATYTGNGNTGGSVPSNATSYQTNETFTVLGNTGTLIKPGYSFAGWKDNLGVDYQPGATYSLANAGVTFSAQWTANPYRVFYNLTEATSGAVPTDSSIYAIANTANVRGNPGNLQRTGYVFAGWADNANRTGRIYVSGDTYTVSTSDINLWAAWTPNTYTITYDVNGASGAPSKNSDSYTVGSAVARLALVGTMAKNGYNFGGWATQAVGTAMSDSFTVAANTTLFAQWTIASFTLTYNLDGGTGTVDSPTAVNYLQQFNLAPSTGFTKTIGSDLYAFVAWSANSATYNPGQSYFMPAANLTFTATWTRIYNVTYSFSGGSVANAIADQQKIALDTITVTSTVPTRTGYNFLHWVDQSGETTTAGAVYVVRDSHYLLYAQWQAVSYSVTYDAASGSPAPSETAKTIGQSFAVGAAPSREFYTFNGWFDGTNTYFPGATYLVGSSNIILTAQWLAKVFTVTYDLNGGAGSAGGNYAHTYGTSAYLLPTSGFARTDYNFGGWATSPSGTSVGTTFAPSSDISLYAIWNIAIYRLSFDGQSGISETATAKVTIGQAIVLPNATRANHTLQGWSTQQSGGSVTAGGASFTPASDGTLYAQWALQVFTVTYNPNLGSVTTPTASFTYGSTTPLVLPRPTRTNYVFDNWYSSAVGGYLIGAADANFTPTSSVTIYAHWIQASLEGLGEATKIAEVTVLTGSNSSFSAGSQGSTASVEYTADSLPAGTVITAYVQKTTTRASSIIDPDYNYVLSIIVAWVAPDGTVPDTAVGKPIVVTITNSQITKGSRIYKLVGTDVRILGTATENGRVQTFLTQDPLVTVAITEPDSPTAISSVEIDGTSASVSWQAPEVTGGSPITEYVATSNAGQSCTTITTTCTITGLSAGTTYTFRVVARNVIGVSNLSAQSASITTSAPPVIPNQNTNNPNNSADAALAAAAQAAAKAAEEKAAAELKAAEELKAAQEKAAAEKAAAELKAAEEKAAADAKAAEEKAAAEVKAQQLAIEDAAKAAGAIVPAVTVYSITNELTLSDYDLAYLRAYLATLKPRAMLTCIGYTYTAITTQARAAALATKQATALCAIIKKERPTLSTSILIRPAESAPPAAAGSQWVAVSYRVDSYQPITPTTRYQAIQTGLPFLAYMPSYTATLALKKIEIIQCATNKNPGLSATYGSAKKSIAITEYGATQTCSFVKTIPKNAKRTIVVKAGGSLRPGARISIVTVGLSSLEIKKLVAGLVRVPLQ
jgi:uncharacterized repeat protein (TIGR02543 family)